jgi:hypothetical protein
MNRRVLTNNGPQVSVLALRCMGMSDSHGPIESIATIRLRSVKKACSSFLSPKRLSISTPTRVPRARGVLDSPLPVLPQTAQRYR